MKKIHGIFVSSKKHGVGKDTFARLLMELLDLKHISYDVVSFASPVIIAYMQLYDEARFDFYKIHPEKRKKLLQFSNAVKKLDSEVFIRKSCQVIDSYIKKDEHREHVIIMPDSRYMFESIYLRHNSKITDFSCANIYQDFNKNEDYEDREPEYEPINKEKFLAYTQGKWIDTCNNGTLGELRTSVHIFAESIGLIKR